MRQEPSARSKESFTISFVTTYSKMNEEFPDNEYDTDRQTDTYIYTHTQADRTQAILIPYNQIHH